MNKTLLLIGQIIFAIIFFFIACWISINLPAGF